MNLRTLILPALTLTLATTALAQPGAEQGPSLKIGDKAPELRDVQWLRGEPLSGWKEGQVYVLDFWATWCGPCIAAMPHVQDLHEEYKDKGVNFVGVSIWPRQGQTPTDQWLAERDQFTYRFAEDNTDGVNANAFMRAAGQNGIPTVMIVDQTGTLAWMGHPMSDMDESLEKILAGEWDPKAYAKEKAEQEARERELMLKVQPIMQRLEVAYRASDWPNVVSAADEILAIDTETFAQLAVLKYYALLESDRLDEASAWGSKAATTIFADNSEMLNEFAWAIVDPNSQFEKEKIDASLAVRMAERASELEKGENPDVLDTLARAYFVAGNREKAIQTQRKALEIAEDASMKEMLSERLQQYLEADDSE